MKLSIFTFLLIFVVAIACKKDKIDYTYESETLKIQQLTENTFVHISYLQTESFGNVPCNGMIVVDNREALIFDTPANDAQSKELLDWLENSLNVKPKGVVATHFHADCLGGLTEFHNRQIPSYASNRTIALAKERNETLPQQGFDTYFELQVGNTNVVNEFFGEGHTRDNIVSYFPSNKVLFGGCLIKEVGAGKGNLADANTDAWSATVARIKTKYENVELVIPGHGKTGGQDLLTYTIELFATNKGITL